MGMYEVTQGGFQEVLGRNPSYFAVTGQFSASVAGKKTTGFPVENVSWYDTIEFCNKLSISDGQVPYYRLTAISRSASQSIISASVAVAEIGRAHV